MRWMRIGAPRACDHRQSYAPQVPFRNAFDVLNITICNNAEQYLRRSLYDAFIAP